MRPSRHWPRLLVAMAAAAALAPAAHALDLNEVWRAATMHDPEFAAARAAHDAGAARRVQAGALWRPTVALEGGAGIAGNDTSTTGARFSAPGFGQSDGVAFDTSINHGTSARAALMLRQPLYNRERDAQSSQLRVSADMADIAWRGAQQSLILRSAERYFDLALAFEKLHLIERQQESIQRALTEAQDRYRLGDRPITAVHEATARAEALEAQRITATTEVELKRAALADLTGMAVPETALPLSTAAPRADDVGALPAWLADAERDNVSLALARMRVSAAESEARKTRDALSPTVDLVAQLAREHLSGTGDFGDASNASTQRSVGVQLSVPLYTGGWRSARQDEARSLIAQARAELERTRQDVALQTRAAWLDVEVGRSQTAALAAAAAASAARLDATRVGLAAGDRTTLDLLNAENDNGAASLALAQARVHVLTSRLRLAAQAGQLDESRLTQVNAALEPGGSH